MFVQLISNNTRLGGFYPTLGITVSMVSILIIMPLVGMFSQAFILTPQELLSILSEERTLSAFKITIITALIATVCNAIFGLLIAWVLVRYEFKGKAVIDASIDLPFALPTAVAGIALVALYDTNDLLGQTLSIFGITVPYTIIGVIMAMIFTSLPFGIRPLQPVIKHLNPHLEEVALTLGASPFIIFFKVIVPQILPAFLKGFSLAFARSLGEFGAVIFIAGNIPFETEVASLLIMIRLEEFDYAGASVIALFILTLSLSISFSIMAYERHQQRERA